MKILSFRGLALITFSLLCACSPPKKLDSETAKPPSPNLAIAALPLDWETKMVVGKNELIEYIASDNTPRRARLTNNVGYTGSPGYIKCQLGINTDVRDPSWEVQQPDGSIATVEWQHFRATDGSERKVKMRCNHQAYNSCPHIICKFIYANTDGSDESGEEPEIWFKHPTGGDYRVIVDSLRPAFATSERPTFIVTEWKKTAQ